MGNKLKCIALSALVLPGLGQLRQGRRLKGGIMIMLDNIFILGALFIALRSVSKLMLIRAGAIGPDSLLAGIQADAPYARWVLGAFLVLWVYSVVDTAFYKENASIN